MTQLLERRPKISHMRDTFGTCEVLRREWEHVRASDQQSISKIAYFWCENTYQFDETEMGRPSKEMHGRAWKQSIEQKKCVIERVKGRASEVQWTHKKTFFTSDRGLSRVRTHLGRARGEKSPYTNNSTIERCVVPYLHAQRTSQHVK
jgi:hypothetical protein